MMNQRHIHNKNCYIYDDECLDGTSDKPNKNIMKAVETILIEIGEDKNREGLKRTPLRFARACGEWFGGYGIKPEQVLNRNFPSEGYNDMLLVKDIEFMSNCEHHMAPFVGFAHIAIISGKTITGLDKFVKLVDIYARRLQTQEVMTHQIGEAIKKVLQPKGIMIMIEAKHLCVGSRETKNKSVSFITTYRYGTFKTKKHLEDRFLSYINKETKW
jgi:GTP cyclohydrolase I